MCARLQKEGVVSDAWVRMERLLPAATLSPVSHSFAAFACRHSSELLATQLKLFYQMDVCHVRSYARAT